MKNQTLTFCTRCERVFKGADIADKTECPFCSFAHIVNVTRAGMTGTQRTADSSVAINAATSATVT